MGTLAFCTGYFSWKKKNNINVHYRANLAFFTSRASLVFVLILAGAESAKKSVIACEHSLMKS